MLFFVSFVFFVSFLFTGRTIPPSAAEGRWATRRPKIVNFEATLGTTSYRKEAPCAGSCGLAGC